MRNKSRQGSVFHECIPLCAAAVVSTTHIATRRSWKRFKRDGAAASFFFLEG